MRKWIFLGALAGLLMACGCQTMTLTRDENLASVRQIWEDDMRQIADDWKLEWRDNRQSRLTQWHMR